MRRTSLRPSLRRRRVSWWRTPAAAARSVPCIRERSKCIGRARRAHPEAGKTLETPGLGSARAQVGNCHGHSAPHQRRASADVGRSDTHSLRQPLGVCAGITPFNFRRCADLDVSGRDRVRQTFVPKRRRRCRRRDAPGRLFKKRVCPTAFSTSCTETSSGGGAARAYRRTGDFVSSAPRLSRIHHETGAGTAAREGARRREEPAVVLPTTTVISRPHR